MNRTYHFRSVIAPIIERYLNLRRSLGRQCRSDNSVLKNLDSFLYKKKKDLTLKSFEDWCHTKENISVNSQYIGMRIVRNLCLYRQRTKHSCFVPDIMQFPKYNPHQRVEPHIFTKAEIIHLADIIKTIKPHYFSPIRQENYKLSLVLLYTSGLRRSEICTLVIGDYNPQEHTLLIRESKFHKSRIIPLSRDGWQELEHYLQTRRSRLLPISPDSPLIWNNSASRNKTNGFYNEGSFTRIFKNLFQIANIKTAKGAMPRVQDFRHAFAAHALLRWYHENADVQSKLPLLSIYMGHVSVTSTEYYLRFIDNVVDTASERFEKKYGGFLKKSNKRKRT